MNYYPHHIGDFNGATRHLTRVERSLYRDMIELYYDTEKPLPAGDIDWLCKKVLAITEEEKKAVADILKEFFTLEGDVYRNARCELEIAAYKDKIAIAAKAGRASAKQRSLKRRADAERPLNGGATNQEPVTKNQEPVTTENRTPANAGVAKPVVPPCPHLDIIQLYHDILPMAQQVNPELWKGARATHLQTRWRENKKRQNLDWWKRFFEHISRSDFLCGRTQPRPGKTPFLLTLGWIVNLENFTKIHEGNYNT